MRQKQRLCRDIRWLAARGIAEVASASERRAVGAAGLIAALGAAWPGSPMPANSCSLDGVE
jgi:hypothetical protein